MESTDLLLKIEAIEQSIDLLQSKIAEKQPRISITNYKTALKPIKCLFIESLKLEAHGDKVYNISWAGGEVVNNKYLASVSGDGRVMV